MIFYSVHFNRPDFIQIQKDCIDKIGGNLVVIKNSDNQEISEECERLNIKMYELPDSMKISHHDSSISHGNALNYLKEIIDYSDDWGIIDHDFFPTKKIDFLDYEILGYRILSSSNVPYLWPGFMCGTKNISLGNINFLPTLGFDSGSGTRSLVASDIRIRYVDIEERGDGNINLPIQVRATVVRFEDFGVHYLNGSGWMPTDVGILNSKNEMLINEINLFFKN